MKKKKKAQKAVPPKGVHLFKETKCPFCKAKLNAGAEVPSNRMPRAPREGDFTVCCKCAEVIVFGEGLKLKKPTLREFREAMRNKDVLMACVIVRAHPDFDGRS